MLAGTAIHFGLEHAAKEIIRTTKLPAYGEAIDAALEKGSELGLFGADDKIRWAVHAGMDFLHQSLEEGYEILEAEQFLDTGFGQWKAKGQIDLVLRHGDDLVVLDWKTCSKLPGNTGECIDPQTTLYGWSIMEKYGVDELLAGRVYLRAAGEDIRVTKAGTVSKQSICSFPAYQTYVNEVSPTSCFGMEEAERRFGRWFRVDTTRLTRQSASAILSRLEKIVLEIEQGLEPHPSWRPKFCPNFCEHYDRCTAETILGQFEEKNEEGYELK